MCDYCSFDGNGMAKKTLWKNGSEHIFIEDVECGSQITSYRNNLDLPYVSFKISNCPKCGRKLEGQKDD